MSLRLTLTALMAALALTACGLKGDPVPPGPPVPPGAAETDDTETEG